MINYSEKFMSKKFTSTTMRHAYMKAVKWVATNVISKDELKNVQIEYEKDKQYPTVTIHLYVKLTEKEAEERHCNICKESHGTFYMNSEYNCSRCNMKAYQRRKEDLIRHKVSYYKELMKKNMEE